MTPLPSRMRKFVSVGIYEGRMGLLKLMRMPVLDTGRSDKMLIFICVVDRLLWRDELEEDVRGCDVEEKELLNAEEEREEKGTALTMSGGAIVTVASVSNPSLSCPVLSTARTPKKIVPFFSGLFSKTYCGVVPEIVTRSS
jgi:hypothetical protein